MSDSKWDFNNTWCIHSDTNGYWVNRKRAESETWDFTRDRMFAWQYRTKEDAINSLKIVKWYHAPDAEVKKHKDNV